MLSEGQSARSLHHKSSLKLHHILQEFKQTEHYKSTLENKINVLRRQYDSNKKKAKNIHFSIMRINEVKQQFRKEKDEVQLSLRRLVDCSPPKKKTIIERLFATKKGGIIQRKIYQPSGTWLPRISRSSTCRLRRRKGTTR